MTAEQADAVSESAETFDFGADVGRIMDIIINSLYTNKEIFLREIISNASDALDKVKYSSLKNPEYLGDEKELEIRIEFNKDEKTVSVSDTGIGMTKTELINNLGTVAKSGTTQFLELIGKTQDMSLIGQFGVGFYSSFLVSNKVVVTSKSNNDPEQHIWQSSADGKFSVTSDPRGNTLKRGSKITMHLKDDAVEFLEQDKISELVKRYSLFCNHPIYLYTHRDVTKQVEISDEDDLYADDDDFDDDDEDFDEDDDEDFEVTDDDEDEDDEEIKKKTITETVWEWELINAQKAIWLRNKNEVEEEEYNELYKGMSKDTKDPLAYTHFAAEGDIEFKSVLFIPSDFERDPSDTTGVGKSNSLKLYVRRVLINDEFEDLMPRYLSFVKGIVDSDDLPLSVSREQLQQLKLIKMMSKKLVRKALDMMRMLAEEEEEYDDDDEDYDDYDDEDEEEDIEEDIDETSEDEEEEGESKYTKFWNLFGKNIKLGVIEDAANRSKLAKLLRFYTTQSTDELTSFDEYLARMPKSQEAIYYLPGDTVDSIMKSPLIKKYEKHGIEVLLLNDPIDEFTMQHLSEYKNKKLKSIAKEDGNAFSSEADQKKKNNIIKDMYKPLTDWWKKHLGKDVEKVAASTRLVDEPAYVFTSQYGYSAHMEKINRAQAFANSEKAADYMLAKKHFEINPHHPIMRELLDRIKSTGGEPDGHTTETMNLIYNMALLNSGFVIEDPTEISSSMQEILRAELGLERTGEFEELEIDIEQDDDEEIEMDLDDDMGEYEMEEEHEIPDDL